ncbi:MAG: ketol-acid reductoisomerase [Proteobacteria bacterium]|nr:ketol-acid reductoisomerase [Pseudomonadota bacterium]
MSAVFFAEENFDTSLIEGLSIAVLGYGSQGRAHALNLRDSACQVRIGLREGGASYEQAIVDGWQVQSVSEAVKGADLICFLCPDMPQKLIYEEEVKPFLKSGACLLFAHGFSVHYGRIVPSPDHDLILCAPKGPGALVRRQFEEGRGVPCLIAVQQDASGRARDKALQYAHKIGGTRAGVLETSFKEETETDLFGEQAVLCGGCTELVKAGFETLVAAGYQPELAYFECLHELKLIVDLLYEGGLSKMHQFISDTAKYGSLVSGSRVIDEHTRSNMQTILKEIQNGSFAARWQQEYETGLKNYRADLQKELNHPIEATGKDLRSQMSWIQDSGSKSDDRSRRNH